MKRILSLVCTLAILLPFHGSSQENHPNGYIITLHGDKVEGSIKTSFGVAGKISFTSATEKKKSLAPSDIKGFQLDGKNYISYSNDFYEELLAGEKARLYRKVTDNSGQLIMNGTDVVGVVKTMEGKKGDYYLITATGTKLDWITEKNFKDYFVNLLNSNDSLSIKIKEGSLGYSQLKTVVELYNEL